MVNGAPRYAHLVHRGRAAAPASVARFLVGYSTFMPTLVTAFASTTV